MIQENKRDSCFYPDPFGVRFGLTCGASTGINVLLGIR